MARLFLTNIPYDCHETDVRRWIEAKGLDVDSVRLVRDLVTGMSPAFGYVSLRPQMDHADAIRLLDGEHLNGRKLQVRRDWRDEHHSRRS